MLNVGDRAPLFVLQDADMETFEQEQEQGKRAVVLFFYPRDNAPTCTSMAADFSDHEEAFARHQCVVIGVSPDDCLTHAEFRDANGLSIRLLSDENKQVCGQYGVLKAQETEDGSQRSMVIRTVFVIDREGVVRHILQNNAGRIFAAEVLQLVKGLE